MIVVLVVVALAFAVLAAAGWCVALIIHRVDESRIGRILAAYDALMVIADKDHAASILLHDYGLEMDERLRLMADEAQVTISDLELQIVQRDEQIARQRTQLAEVQYVKLDTPKRPARKVAKASNVTGSDGAQ